MRDRIVIDDTHKDGFRLVWYLAEEQDFGGYVGEGPAGRPEPNRETNPDNWECWTADKIARDDPHTLKDPMGCYWDSRSRAKSVLDRINAAFRMKRPMTDWEKKALDAGWTPPKGWR